MKRLLACVSFIAATTTAALSTPTPAAKATAKPVPTRKASPIRVAPADEYFGKLKLSVLGIRNTIKDVGANIEIDQTRWAQQASKASFAEDAMHDWEHKYPQDTWLAKTVFALERMYAKLDTDEGRQHSLLAMRWLVHDFPATWYGRMGKKELALGKVGRPLQTAATAPTPSPDPNQVSSPAPLSSAVPSFGSAGSASGSGSGSGTPDQAAAGIAPSPVPLPSMSPTTHLH